MNRLRLVALACLLGAGGASTAQTPENKTNALVMKFTETWCGPCGAWGWQLADEVIPQLAGKGYYWGVMGSSDPTSMNANCYTTFSNNYSFGGYPTFMVGDDDGGTSASQIISAVNAFNTTAPTVSCAAFMSISGNTINVTAKAKFWTAASGEYYMSAFAVEDGVMAQQASKTGTVAHHHILRGTMDAALSPWGNMIASGNTAAAATFSKNYSIAIQPSWVKEKMEVYVVLYKKVGDKYRFQNIAKATPAATGIDEQALLQAVTLYPNPAKGQVNIDIKSAKSTDVSITVSDQLGRVIYRATPQSVKQGNNTLSLQLQGVSAGMYQVALSTADGSIKTLKLAVQP